MPMDAAPFSGPPGMPAVSSARLGAGFAYAFDCGDGAGLGAFGAANSVDCPTLDNGLRAVAGAIRDKDGGANTYTGAVSVENVAPTVGAITAPTHPVGFKRPVDVSASFTDPGVVDTHTAVIDWGDGTTSAATVAESGGSGAVRGSHT